MEEYDPLQYKGNTGKDTAYKREQKEGELRYEIINIVISTLKYEYSASAWQTEILNFLVVQSLKTSPGHHITTTERFKRSLWSTTSPVPLHHTKYI